MNKTKTLGQVFTPPHIVKTILNEIGYSGETILNKTILEPSFGDAIFFYHIIEKINKEAKNKNLTINQTETIIDNNLWGIEYDKTTYQNAVQKLKQWAKTTHNLNLNLPHLIQQDTLTFKPLQKFDYIVGNPPYIRIHNLAPELRNQLKQYKHSQGNTDLYVIFIELGLTWLKENGTLGYITPNSWFKNSSQKDLRRTLIQENLIQTIINYGTTKIFPTAGTYTAISILSRNNTEIKYVNHQPEYVNHINYDTLKTSPESPWNFSSPENTTFLEELKGEPLNLYFKAQNGIATLGDKYYLVTKNTAEELKLEKEFLREAIKASTYKGKTQNTLIIFPYHKKNNKWEGITEEHLKTSAPNIYQYLLKNKKALSNRSLEKGNLWFWYGRSQAIQTVDQPKIVLPPLLKETDTTHKIYQTPKNTLIYSGLFITETTKNIPLNELVPLLSQPQFARYLKIKGKDMSGGYKSFNSKTVQQYLIQLESPSNGI